MELIPVADLKPFRTECRVEVKVLHTWKQYTKLSGESLEIIFSDAHVSLRSLQNLSIIDFSLYSTKLLSHIVLLCLF